jgi:transposase
MHTLGIDIAKASFDATLLTPSGAQLHRVFANVPAGFSELAAWLDEQPLTQLHACMEATNVYWEALAAFLHARGTTVSVVNPSRIKGFAQATMQRNKTDKLDSSIIAAFCLKHQPNPWEPMSEQQKELRALMRHREDLLQTKLQQQNRLRDATTVWVRQSLEHLLDAINDQLVELEQQIKQQVASDATMKANQALLLTITGVGMVVSSSLLAEFGDLGEYASAKAAAADAGLNPARYESGTSVRRRTRLSKQGKAGVRAVLYLPAMRAMRCCPGFKAFADGLRARGKAPKAVICAVMRKMVHVAYGVLKHQTPYDPLKVCGRLAPLT